tara:strand:- start:11685 stop:12158 length:474 start_codon:yes stop_codon:yes gene_type:complete
MVDEKEFFEKADNSYRGETEIIDPELIRTLKVNRDELMQLYAKLIANPYLAPNLVNDFRSNLVNTIATLIEHGIPVDPEGKIRTADDVIKEGLMELGGIMGGKLFGAGLKAKKAFQDTLKESGETEVYRDPEDGSYYYIDPETGEEIDCDVNGNALE